MALQLTRRTLIGAFGATAATALLAACGAATPTAAPTKPAAPAPAATTAPAPAGKPTSPPAATTAPAATKPAAAAATKPAVPTVAAAATKPAAGTAPVGVGFVKGPIDGEAKTLTGAGATFPAPLYTKWFDEYFKLTQVKVNYQSIGSGGGIKGITDGTVDFGASDGPMTDEQIKTASARGEILHVPMTLGGVAMTYNLPGMTDPLKLTADTIAGVYLGEIKKWNDPKLTADNPGLAAIDKEIVVVHRSDGSGTTYAFTDYLSAVSPVWKTKVGNATSVKWPVGLGGKGNEGVAGEVKQNQYSIGYVEVIYALQNKLGVSVVKNQAGKFTEPKLDAVTAAANAMGDKVPVDLRASIVNAPGDAAYPISTFTWLLVYKTMTDKPKAVALTRLMWWNIHDGQKFSSELGYAPLPDPIVKKCEEKILSINVNDQRALPSA